MLSLGCDGKTHARFPALNLVVILPEVNLRNLTVLILLLLTSCASTNDEKDVKYRIDSNTYVNSEGVIIREVSKQEGKKILRALDKQMDEYNIPRQSEYETCEELLALLKERNLEVTSVKEREVEIKLKWNLWRNIHLKSGNCLD
ncbi:hypothetical protein WH43_13545 [Rheinheimera sp. KL1]|uniref:hypothetical protein n=1 Tax=Rheinheimera sp. KL1 TaxID=1635005 RepID=UPI0006A9BB8D|nr:hypothetical protein [Rheinheimera sp. KL1]KOO57717.1 hypothetical protein WH43_13545 [Rheinheimera sp. KL1]